MRKIIIVLDNLDGFFFPLQYALVSMKNFLNLQRFQAFTILPPKLLTF